MALSSLLITVAAGAMVGLAVARISYVNLVQLAVCTVAVKFTISYSAGHAAINFVFHSLFLLFIQYSRFTEKLSKDD